MNAGIELMASGAMGYTVAQARSYKAVNKWVVWVGVSLIAALLWIWATPHALLVVQADWRDSIASIVTFALSSKGAGSMLKDANAAPPTDSK